MTEFKIYLEYSNKNSPARIRCGTIFIITSAFGRAPPKNSGYTFTGYSISSEGSELVTNCNRFKLPADGNMIKAGRKKNFY
jgi:hypothetical protein